MAKCSVCGKDMPISGYNMSSLCNECYIQKEKSYSRQSTQDELIRRQRHFGQSSLNEDMPIKGYGNLSD